MRNALSFPRNNLTQERNTNRGSTQVGCDLTITENCKV